MICIVGFVAGKKKHQTEAVPQGNNDGVAGLDPIVVFRHVAAYSCIKRQKFPLNGFSNFLAQAAKMKTQAR